MMILCILLLSLSQQSSASIEFRSQYIQSQERVTTEKIWVLDPSELNPHRRRWVLKRGIDLKGLAPVERGREQFGVKADVLETLSQSFLRGEGPWYSPLSYFPCSKDRSSEWFSTPEGSQKAADEAAKTWDEILSHEKVRLALLLKAVSASSAKIATERAHAIFRRWVLDVDREWRQKSAVRGRRAEWDFYWRSASEFGLCRKREKERQITVPTWKEMMERLPEPASMSSKLLARAPARRWNGVYSVRLNVRIGNHTLNGQFLIDSSSPQSVVSPAWLENQGVLPAWVEVLGVPLKRARWSGRRGTEAGLARTAAVDEVFLGGLKIPIREFLIAETDFFSPPEHLASCCDGILGSDFLRHYVVQFRTETPFEVVIWPREGFHPGKDMPWVEVSSNERGDILSSCVLKTGGTIQLQGLRWDTGGEASNASFGSAFPGGGDLHCDDLRIAQGVSGGWDSVIAVGMTLLGRGPFIFDLPHGRLWFTTQGLDSPVPLNRTGLVFQYRMSHGDRVLALQAGALPDKGLRPGMTVTRVDSKPVEDMDLWEVKQRLSGVYGDIVTLEWKKGRGSVKIAPVRVRD